MIACTLFRTSVVSVQVSDYLMDFLIISLFSGRSLRFWCSFRPRGLEGTTSRPASRTSQTPNLSNGIERGPAQQTSGRGDG